VLCGAASIEEKHRSLASFEVHEGLVLICETSLSSSAEFDILFLGILYFIYKSINIKTIIYNSLLMN
jgi:hypothetical protein